MTHTVSELPEELSIKESAAHKGVSLSTVRRWIAAGELRAYRYGKRTIRIRREDLDKMGQQIAAATWQHVNGVAR